MGPASAVIFRLVLGQHGEAESRWSQDPSRAKATASPVSTVRVGKAARQSGVSTQNSLPSGSARTVHGTSP